VFQRFGSLLLVATIFLVAGGAFAQADPNSIHWVEGPAICPLGNTGEIDLPEGYVFADADGARTLLEFWGNIIQGNEMGAVVPMDENAGWVVIFEFNPIGYVKDTEKDDLDADELLESLMKGNKQGNKQRRKMGLPELHLIGWQIPPYYDEVTNNLKWGINLTSDNGETVNFSTRILGRGGAMSADLVLDPLEFDSAFPQYEELLTYFSYTDGNRYSEFREGDRIAEIGLTALIAGGVGAAAVKTGLLARFWKFIVAGVAALFAFIKRLFGKGKKEEEVVVLEAEPVDPDEEDEPEEPTEPTDRT